MTMYRQDQNFQERMYRLQSALSSAILADNTREMGALAGDAHAEAMSLRSELRRAVEAGEGTNQEMNLLRAAQDAIEVAINAAQKQGLSTSVPELRARLLDFKTSADHADAYFRALGSNEKQ